MNAETLEALKTFIELFSSILAILFNSLLIYLIATKSPSKMGTYRHLMTYFCCCSIVFAVLQIAVEPMIYSRGSAFFIIMNLRTRRLPMWLAVVLLYALCACCGVTIYGIAVHFVYRYFALERQGRLRYFKGAYLVLWLFLPLVGALNWAFICNYFFSMNPSASEYLNPITRDVFHLSIDQVAYSAAVFWIQNTRGETEFNWKSGFGLIDLLVTMWIPFVVLIIAGAKSWTKIRGLLKQGESQYSRNLQMQLYKALVAQTLIPVLLIFIPFAMLFLCPLFLVDCEFLSAPITFIYAIYPALDPLPTLFFVDNYRNAIGKLCCKSRRVHDSGSGVEEGRDSRNSRTF
ncbi:unnamed protein product [Caenorhabditis sp. 36 PRJEB53466]|nr:unnamed protein product [Caenorhabditis sp. 36 PRJEB53466]